MSGRPAQVRDVIQGRWRDGGDVAASEGPASDKAAMDPAAHHESENKNPSPARMNSIARRRDANHVPGASSASRPEPHPAVKSIPRDGSDNGTWGVSQDRPNDADDVQGTNHLIPSASSSSSSGGKCSARRAARFQYILDFGLTLPDISSSSKAT